MRQTHQTIKLSVLGCHSAACAFDTNARGECCSGPNLGQAVSIG